MSNLVESNGNKHQGTEDRLIDLLGERYKETTGFRRTFIDKYWQHRLALERGNRLSVFRASYYVERDPDILKDLFDVTQKIRQETSRNPFNKKRSISQTPHKVFVVQGELSHGEFEQHFS